MWSVINGGSITEIFTPSAPLRRGTFPKSDDENFESVFSLYIVVFGGGWVEVELHLRQQFRLLFLEFRFGKDAFLA